MELHELIALRAEYEKELMLAQAKVSVISDIIAKAKAKEQVAVETEVEETEQYTTDTNY